MPSVRPTAIHTLRYTLAAAVLCLTAASGSTRVLAQLQPQGPQPIPKAPALQNFTLTDKSVTVTIARLDPGQTVTQVFTPKPSPAAAPMALSGEWPIAIVSGGEGQVNRKIKAVLKSPFGQTVAEGCGFSKTAPASAGQNKPALSAAGLFQPGNQDALGSWSVTVSYCDALGAPPSGASRVLGDIKITVSFRAATS
jgi:hypothetical protein